MRKAKLIADKDFKRAQIDERDYGSFIELSRLRCLWGIYQPGHLLADEEGFRTDVLDLVRKLGVPVVRIPEGNLCPL